MKAPSGLLGVIQLVVLKAGRVLATNSAMTTSFTATMTLLNRAVSRMPATSNDVMATTTAIAGTFRTASVAAHPCPAASYVNGDETNLVGRLRPKSLARLTT